MLPRKQNKIQVKKRYLNFLIISIGDSTLLKKKIKGIWSGLYEFPSLEFKKDLSVNEVVESKEWINFFYKNNFQINNISSVIIHKLSHQKLHIKFFHVECNKVNSNDYKLFKKDKLLDLPVSKLIENYISQLAV
jgi:A/G-specific adenine glycosylase